MAQQTYNNLDTLFDVRTILNANATDAETRLTALEPSGPANSVVRQDGGGALEGFSNFTYGISGDTTTFTMGIQAAGTAATLFTINAYSETQYLDDTGSLMARFYRSGTDLFWEEGGAYQLHVNGVRLINTGGGTNVLTDDGSYQPLPAGGTDVNVEVSGTDTTPGNLVAKLQGSNGVTYQINNGGGDEQLQFKNPAGAAARQWNFDGSSTADGDPGSGNYRFNNVNQNLVTEIYISKNANPQGNFGPALLALRNLDRVFIEVLVGASYKTFQLTGMPVDNTTYVTLPVTNEVNGPDVANFDQCSLGIWFTRGGAGAPSVGATLEMNGSDGAGGWVGSDWLVNGNTLQPKTATAGTISSATDEDLFLLSAGAAGQLWLQGVGLSKTAPTAGQVLTATSTTQAEWQTGAQPSSGTVNELNSSDGSGGWLATDWEVLTNTITYTGGAGTSVLDVTGNSFSILATADILLDSTAGTGDIRLEPGGDMTVTLGSPGAITLDTSTAGVNGAVNVTALGQILLDNTFGTSDINIDPGGDFRVTLGSPGSVEINTTTAGSNGAVNINALGQIVLDNTTGSAQVELSAGGALRLIGGTSLVLDGSSGEATWPASNAAGVLTNNGTGTLSWDAVPVAGGAPVDVTKAAASAGVSADFSRADHKHDISTAAAVSSGGANAEGSATSLARSDHTHLLTQFGGTVDAQNNDIDNVKTVTFNSLIDAGNMGATETIDWTAGQKQAGTNSANCTISFTNPAGPCNLMFRLTNGGAFSLTWPASVEWPGGTEPTWTAAGVDVISFFFDGTTYYAMAGLAFS